MEMEAVDVVRRDLVEELIEAPATTLLSASDRTSPAAATGSSWPWRTPWMTQVVLMSVKMASSSGLPVGLKTPTMFILSG